jgi:hypothetical protein
MLDEQDATNRDAKGLPFTVSFETGFIGIILPNNPSN